MEAGADILQVFEAMGGFISEDHFYDRAMPCLSRYSTKFKWNPHYMLRLRHNPKPHGLPMLSPLNLQDCSIVLFMIMRSIMRLGCTRDGQTS